MTMTSFPGGFRALVIGASGAVKSMSGVAAVARRVGYESEEAFSRAFKRATGQSPSASRSATPQA